ncbi:Nop14-like protein [Amniculicola lignicola CBS 123094]|uniref:Nop14-like protein n=1 Tax=Amniculicola lignicola CBS 123094 TaxID=1392246 RepID=A0A6A5WMA6_9PLEO|nr:Nop14-like protein [Amniculicola lignicola CBS 123094]
MPPSQLKRLKASLRENGVVGPQKSKKQKQKAKSTNDADARAHKAAALANIRETFNPFEVKHLSRPKKFEYVTNRPQDAKGKKILGRPGVTKSQGEETRRKTLLLEMNNKKKVGGILDRRIGENDPGMSLDDRMMARFEREQQRKRGGGGVFDLEEMDDEVELTHGGRALEFEEGEGVIEDYDAGSVEGSSDGEDGFLKRKRRRDDDGEENNGPEGEAEDQPERKKTKAEVMKEVIAKSKQHKYERQQQKEDDDELREALDKDLNDVLAALRGHMNKPTALEQPKEAPKNNFAINPDRAAMLEGKSREAADKEYDTRVRQLLSDQRAKPTERTKTEEEKARDEAKRLKELEEKRLRRMRGEPDSESEDEPKSQNEEKGGDEEIEEEERNDAAEFGLPVPDAIQGSRPAGVDDEDDFAMDDDLIATDSEADVSDISDEDSIPDDTMAVDEDDDFLKFVLPEKKTPQKAVNSVLTLGPQATSKLAYTYPCPRSHEELLEVFKDVVVKDVPTVIQRIRALYHAGLRAENNEKLPDFACALVDHISYMSLQTPPAPLGVIETVIRHIHSISRSYPTPIATHFRKHLSKLQASNSPTPGDLTILTAIGSIFPTSDHFHQVVTPAITLMGRWMGLASPASTADIATGAYIGALCIQYQRLPQRYIPELIRYTVLCLQSPCITPTLITAHTKNIFAAADMWSTSPAFIEIFTPLLGPLITLKQAPTLQRLRILLAQSRQRRRPQTLHYHRPLPLKTSIPKFEESFDPNKHYDPDRERSDAAKLRKEFKRETKGALRELRKDNSFIAREQLRDQKEKGKRYNEKMRKLVAEIQTEEGTGKNEYERERRNRKRGR